MTSLLSFCAISRPPSFVAMMPSALLPSTCQTSFHCCPAAITPGISVTVYGRGPLSGALAAPRRGPPARDGGGVLQAFSTSGSLSSAADCTPGPDRLPVGGTICAHTATAPSIPSIITQIPVDLIEPPRPAFQNIKPAAVRATSALR